MSEAVKNPENFHGISEKRKELRALQKKEQSKSIRRSVAEALEEVNRKAGEFSIQEEGGLSGAKERLTVEKERAEQSAWLDEKAIATELGPEAYETFTKLAEELDSLTDFEFRRLRGHIGGRRAQQELLKTIRAEKTNLQTSLDSLRKKDPLFTHALDLVAYKRGLHREGHIAPVPSVVSLLHEIGSRMISGKPIFLHGPTGTGKTSLARYAAQHFTGANAEMVYCSPQTRESGVWGRQGIRLEQGQPVTVDIYGPLTLAMQKGKPIIFDEFTALPKEQMVFIKGIFNAKPGDTVNVTNNGMVTIEPGFQMIFTANLKSEKNPEKADLPPEIAREFEQNNLEVNYTPPDESYDIMLARLMNPDGSVDLSYHDLNETLPKLCEAMREIQIAYTDTTATETARLTGTLDASGKRPGLKKLVLTQGTIENILDGWNTERQINADRASFTEFLDQRLKTALTFREYPEADRMLAAKILASKGFLRTVTAAQLGLPADLFNFDAAKKLRGDSDAVKELTKESAHEVHVSLKGVAELDPFGRRTRKAIEAAAQFLPKEEREHMPERERETELTELKPFLAETFKLWYGNKSQAEINEAANRIPEMISPADIDYPTRQNDAQESKFGEYTLNPDTVLIDWEQLDRSKIEVINPTKGQMKAEGFPYTVSGMAGYILKKFGATHIVPGVEYWKFAIENPAKVPNVLKDGNYHFFFGSLFRPAHGNWYVPCTRWNGAKFYRYGNWLNDDWNSNYRVVLVKK